MKTKLLTVCFSVAVMAFGAASGRAQERPVQAALTIDAGASQTRDTYLAPLLYEGSSLGVRFERLRTMRSGKWHNLQVIDASMATADAESGKNSSMNVGRASYRYAMHRKLPVWHGLDVKVGPYAGIEGGYDYNLKLAAANNPATARVVGNVGASVLAGMKYAIRGRECGVNLLVQMPLVGAAFRPEYGESYYEAFLLTERKHVNFTSLHNQQDLDVRLSTDIPLAAIPGLRRLKTVVRVGGFYHIETMDINKIVTRHSAVGLTIGWTWKYLPL